MGGTFGGPLFNKQPLWPPPRHPYVYLADANATPAPAQGWRAGHRPGQLHLWPSVEDLYHTPWWQNWFAWFWMIFGTLRPKFRDIPTIIQHLFVHNQKPLYLASGRSSIREDAWTPRLADVSQCFRFQEKMKQRSCDALHGDAWS
jgi:hypothetical protein